MVSIKQTNAYILMESLLTTLLSVMICIAAIHHLLMVMQTYISLQQKFKIQHAKLIARHYIQQDLQQFALDVAACSAQKWQCDHLVSFSIQQQISNKNIKPFSNILVIHGVTGDIVYYLRKSVLPKRDNLQPYALYRDDIVHNAQALVESIDNFTVEIRDLDITTYEVIAHVYFRHRTPLQIKCSLAKQPR